MPILPFAIKAITKGAQVAKTFKAGKAAQAAAKKPAPRPAPTPKAAPKKPVIVKKPVAVIPAPANPPVKPTASVNTYRILGMDVPKPLAWVGGTAIGAGILYKVFR